MEHCVDEQYQEGADHWQALHANDIDARNRAMEDKIVACLRDPGFGFDTLDDATRDEIDRRDPDVRRSCLLHASEAVGDG